MAYSSNQHIAAKEGKAFINGEEILNGIKFELKIEKEKAKTKIIGRRSTGHKTLGYEVTGTITEYKATSRYAKMMKQYKETGQDVYFTLVGITNDPSSGRGREQVVAYECNIDSVTLLDLDAEGEVIKVEVPFTAEDFDIPEYLKDSL